MRLYHAPARVCYVGRRAMPSIAPTARIGPDVALADDVVIEDHVIIGDPDRRHAPTVVGGGSVLRAGTIVYPGVTLGGGVQTGHHAVIRGGTTIGSAVVVGTNTVIEGDARIGDRVKLQSNVLVPTNTTIEADVFIGPGVQLTNDKPMAAYLRGIYPRERALRGPTIRRGARIGGNATILPELEIGADAVVGAGAVVTHDVAPGTVVVGVPARAVGTVPAAERVASRGAVSA
jgi:acetyltransferase-like isoleucine patch superfamily enzyme